MRPEHSFLPEILLDQRPEVIENLQESRQRSELNLNVSQLNQSISLPSDDTSTTIIAKMDEKGMTEDRVIDQLMKWINEAVVGNPSNKDWIELPDRKARLQLINMVLKVRKVYKPDNVINIVNAFGTPARNLY